MSGLDFSGFSILRLDEIKSQLEQEFRNRFGQNTQLEPETFNGQIIGIFAEREAAVWELAENVYHAQYVMSAEGAALDDVVALVGIQRLPATFSTVVLTLGGDPATLIPAGSIVRDPVTLQSWVTLADATIGGGGTINVDARASVTGPIPGLSGTITELVTNITGWDTVTNALDAERGRNVESDAALRVRYFQAMFVSGGSSLEAMRSSLLRLQGVTSVSIYENDTDAIDAEGRPAHSFEVVIEGGDDQQIADTIWRTKPVGIRAYGTGAEAAINVVDSQGNTREVGFTRPVLVSIFVDIDYSITTDFPSDGEDLMLEAVLDKGDTFVGGQDVIAFQFVQVIEVPGIRSMVLRVGRVSNPTTFEEAISVRELADFDSSRVSITRV